MFTSIHSRSSRSMSPSSAAWDAVTKTLVSALHGSRNAGGPPAGPQQTGCLRRRRTAFRSGPTSALTASTTSDGIEAAPRERSVRSIAPSCRAAKRSLVRAAPSLPPRHCRSAASVRVVARSSRQMIPWSGSLETSRAATVPRSSRSRQTTESKVASRSQPGDVVLVVLVGTDVVGGAELVDEDDARVVDVLVAGALLAVDDEVLVVDARLEDVDALVVVVDDDVV